MTKHKQLVARRCCVVSLSEELLDATACSETEAEVGFCFNISIFSQVTNFQLIGKNLLLGITNIPIVSLNSNQLTELEVALDLPAKATSLSKSSLTKINLNHNVNLLAKTAYEATRTATDLLLPQSLFEDPAKAKKKVSDKDTGHGVVTLEVSR